MSPYVSFAIEIYKCNSLFFRSTICFANLCLRQQNVYKPSFSFCRAWHPCTMTYLISPIVSDRRDGQRYFQTCIRCGWPIWSKGSTNHLISITMFSLRLSRCGTKAKSASSATSGSMRKDMKRSLAIAISARLR